MLTPLHTLAEEEEHGHKGKGHTHRHHVALFLGGAHGETEIEQGEHGESNHSTKSADAFTVGLDYEYRLSSVFGIGGLVEYAGGDLEATGVLGALFIHPVGGLKFILAPGVEHEGGHNKFLFRTGVYYDFFFGKFSVSPNFNVDFVDGDENLVYGVSFGYGF